jgi:segregation and condensation protein A
MTEEENIMQLILQNQSWEEVIYHIVSIEQLDPWNIDLIKLTESFLGYMSRIEELDFRIPAKIVFVAAVLLRLKSDYLSIFEEEETIEEMAKAVPFVDLGIDPNLIQLGLPMKRMPKRQVTLDELMTALKRALVVKERRTERKMLWQAQLQAQISEEDITKRIEALMGEIDNLMEKLKQDRLEFSKIVKKWNKDQIVDHFIPLLHLEQNQKIKTEQEDFFKEIYISRRISQSDRQESSE